MSMLPHIFNALEEAKRCNHRHLFLLSGRREWGLSTLKSIFEGLPNKTKIIFTWKRDFSLPGEIEDLKNSDKYLGKTYDILALDFHHSLIPNDLGKLVGVVRGGGAIFILAPEIEKWKMQTNYFHETILTPPYSLSDVKHNFISWLLKKMLEHGGISINLEGQWIKKSNHECEGLKNEINESEVPEYLRGVSKTQDQVNVLSSLINKNWKAVVLTADRGRGKSSALGIYVANEIFTRNVRKVGITAPNKRNVEELFKFLKSTLSMLGVVFRSDGKSIFGKNFVVEFKEPLRVSPKKYDLMIVDEAAGIAVPQLLRFLKSKRVVYSTTVHGYEGTGRAFAIRFMGEIRRRKSGLLELKMKEPIRYASDDPIERWLFDTLLLDSEPADIGSVDLRKLEYKKYTIEELLQDERKLREYYGIFVLAHYRNNPNDFGILCDAPNQEIRTLEYNGHVVCSVQMAKEGGIENFADEMYYGMVPAGNIIPDIVVKHYRNREFLKMKGLRIVRIATHPSLMNMGIGSLMLENISRENFDWFGAAFGATASLIRFWISNGFYPIHISPKINEKTGEYSVTVLKAHNTDEMRRIFGRRFVRTLGEVHSSLDPELAQLILDTVPKRGKIKLDEVDWKRLIAYAWGPGNYEVTMDVLQSVGEQYFLTKSKQLTAEQKQILIAKLLQHRSWAETGKAINRGDMYVVIEMREIIRKLIGGKYDEEISEFQRRFHGENKRRREESNAKIGYKGL